jgi:type IV pilus assembly protein PilO
VNEVPALTNQISTAARLAGMEISELVPDGSLPGDYFDAVKYRLSVTGPYHKVGEFLANVGSLSRIVTPMNVDIIPSGRVIERRPGRNERFVDARLQVQTYVAKTVATPPAAPPKPGGR